MESDLDRDLANIMEELGIKDQYYKEDDYVQEDQEELHSSPFIHFCEDFSERMNFRQELEDAVHSISDSCKPDFGTTEELKNTAESHESIEVLATASNEVHAVLLVDNDGRAPEEIFPISTLTKEKIPFFPNVKECQEESIQEEPIQEEEKKFDLTEHFLSTYSTLKEEQALKDEGNYEKKGPGRKRKNLPRTTTQLKALIREYLDTNLSKVVTTGSCRNRKDALITVAMRILK